MKSRLLFALSLLCIPLSSLADEQWETTTTMQSSSFPMQMPPTTTKVCVPDGQYDKPSEKMIPTENDCKVTSFKVSGNTSNFRVECPSPKMVGDGSFTRKSATAFSGTEPPFEVSTGRFSMIERSRRESSDSDTVIGIWRSDSENFALFCSMSPSVAMRIVWLSAAVVTPRSAARSKRGVIVISGCGMSPPTRGAIKRSC